LEIEVNYSQPWASEGCFLGGKWFSPGVAKRIFPGGKIVVKFYFIQFKLRELPSFA